MSYRSTKQLQVTLVSLWSSSPGNSESLWCVGAVVVPEDYSYRHEVGAFTNCLSPELFTRRRADLGRYMIPRAQQPRPSTRRRKHMSAVSFFPQLHKARVLEYKSTAKLRDSAPKLNGSFLSPCYNPPPLSGIIELTGTVVFE